MRNDPVWVYFITDVDDREPIKIGWARDVDRRIAELQTPCPFKLKLIRARRGSQADEHKLHVFLAKHKVHGEWFARHPDVLAAAEGCSGPEKILPIDHFRLNGWQAHGFGGVTDP